MVRKLNVWLFHLTDTLPTGILQAQARRIRSPTADDPMVAVHGSKIPFGPVQGGLLTT